MTSRVIPSRVILGYWDARGMAQSIRYMLKYSGVSFVDKRYPFGEGTSIKDLNSIRKHWYGEKFQLGLDFPNLPYFIDYDNNIKLTQSSAIMRFLGRKYQLHANDEKSMIRQDMLEQQLKDFLFAHLRPLNLSPDYEKLKDDFIKNQLPLHMSQFSKFLGDNKWFSGESLTFVDFFAYEVIDWIRWYHNPTLEQFTNLIEYANRFKKLPPIEAYINSNEFKEWPLFSPIWKFGYFK